MNNPVSRGQGLDHCNRCTRRLAEIVQQMVEESGHPEGFDATAWAVHWLDQPYWPLGERKPSEFMCSESGRRLVASLLARMQRDAYS